MTVAPNRLRQNYQKLINELSVFLRRPSIRVPLLIGIHCALFTAIYSFSFAIRYDFQLSADNWHLLRGTLPAVVLTKLMVFYFGRHFHGWWRYVTFADLGSLLRVSLLSMVCVVFVDYYLLIFKSQIPRLTILLDMLLTIIVVGGLRCSWRFIDQQLKPMIGRQTHQPAIIIGTNHIVGQLIGSINANRSVDLRVRAVLSTDPKWCRSFLGGVPVVGCIDDLAEVAKRFQAKDVLVASGLMGGRDLRELVQKCNANQLNLRVLPRLEDTLRSTNKIPLRPLDINDLLKRDPVVLDDQRLFALIQNKRVLVTGAGGSIGSEICRQLMEYRPSQLILLGRGENRIHAIHLELTELAAENNIELIQVIGSITDHSAMERVFQKHEPEIVFHAAAHKHVPLMEMHVGEAIKNNVLGTKIIAELASKYRAGHFVLVSSDKAVNPTSIMGCTKHLAERVVHELSDLSETKFVVVRFGNVLGSAGSVIPVFQKQIEKGGPIRITDPRMTRFFMSIPEAAQLVMQAAAMADGGEIFVLDMGQPILITQLAEDLVSLSGLPEGSIEFEFTGIRPGEKLYEELYFDDESTIPTKHPKVRAAAHRQEPTLRVLEQLPGLLFNVEHEPEQLRQLLSELVTSYHQPAMDADSESTTSSEDEDSLEPAQSK